MSFIQPAMQQVFVRFLCGLFNDGVSIPQYTALNISVNDELERMWQEAVVT
jgi:hypothetical protein